MQKKNIRLWINEKKKKHKKETEKRLHFFGLDVVKLNKYGKYFDNKQYFFMRNNKLAQLSQKKGRKRRILLSSQIEASRTISGGF